QRLAHGSAPLWARLQGARHWSHESGFEDRAHLSDLTGVGVFPMSGSPALAMISGKQRMAAFGSSMEFI
ncbi:hypothetical protein, partial [Pseudomonas sp. Sample_14]|uniref:hypothetical protein n=1 Tax=Pseudomonas sp. Sample_14 TaxID=2448262 RepID=UPI0019D54EA0